MTPEEHDGVTSVISHFPHIVAASLVHQAHHSEEDYPFLKRFAVSGFRDITRIASSSPAMWRDILLHNKDKLLDRFKEWKREIDTIESYVENEDADSLFGYFKKAKDYRDGLPLRQKGAIPSFYDLYVDVPDHPGSFRKLRRYWQKKKSVSPTSALSKQEKILTEFSESVSRLMMTGSARKPAFNPAPNMTHFTLTEVENIEKRKSDVFKR